MKRAHLITSMVFVLCAGAGALLYQALPEIKLEWNRNGSILPWGSASSVAYQPKAGFSQREVSMVYVGSSRCLFSSPDSLATVVEAVKLSLARKAESLGYGFAAAGVSLDRSTTVGVEYLGQFGLFDELTVGRGWLNSAAMRYIWQDIPGMAATPQVLVTVRDFESVPVGDGDTPGVSRPPLMRGERLLARKIGSLELKNWLAAGTPLPTITPGG